MRDWLLALGVGVAAAGVFVFGLVPYLTARAAAVGGDVPVVYVVLMTLAVFTAGAVLGLREIRAERAKRELAAAQRDGERR